MYSSNLAKITENVPAIIVTLRYISLPPTGQLCSQHPERARRGAESTDSGGDHAGQTQSPQRRTLPWGNTARRTHQRICGVDGRWVELD